MARIAMLEQDITESIIGAFYTVYNELRFGFLESVYATALEELLSERGHVIAREATVPVCFRGKPITTQRLDMLVDNRVVVEIKSTEILHRSAHRQLLNYLRATALEVGLLLHFGPEPRFYRVVQSNPPLIRVDSPDPR